MRVLITGGAGFIGSHLAEYFLDQGHEVFIIDNLSTGYEANVPDGCTFECQDVTNAFIVGVIFEKFKPDFVYHCAAFASEQRSTWIREFITHNNTLSTSVIINACVKHHAKLIFLSSVAVYSGTPPFLESTLPNPIDTYGISKFCSELEIKVAGEVQGLDWCIIRPRNVFGEKQSIWDRSRNLFGIWCYNALHGLPLTIYGDGSQRRTFTYIEDIIPSLYNAKDVSKEIINLGSRNDHSVKGAAAYMCRVAGLKYEDVVIHTEARHEVKEAYCDTNKSRTMLEFRERNTLLGGLDSMWAWAKQQPDRPLQVMPELEVTTNAHSSLK